MDMMDELPIARQYLRRPDPHPFREVGRHHEIDVQISSRWDQEILPDIDHQVRLAEAPSFGEVGRSG
jgi:hypothetical protein